MDFLKSLLLLKPFSEHVNHAIRRIKRQFNNGIRQTTIVNPQQQVEFSKRLFQVCRMYLVFIVKPLKHCIGESTLGDDILCPVVQSPPSYPLPGRFRSQLSNRQWTNPCSPKTQTRLCLLFPVSGSTRGAISGPNATETCTPFA